MDSCFFPSPKKLVGCIEMARKMDSISINVGNGEQKSTWPDGNRMNEPDLNEGQEIKQGGVMSSQRSENSLKM